MKFSWLLVVLLFPKESALASIDAYPFPNKELTDRYEQLISELRCPQCLNTNLAGSDAMIAQDLRREVHRMLIEDKTDNEVLDFMYFPNCKFVLYDPRFDLKTLALWLSPVLLFLAAGFFWLNTVRAEKDALPWDADDEKKLNEILEAKVD